MRLVRRMFLEIVISSLLLLFFDSLLTALLFFSFFYLVFTFFRIDMLFAGISSLLFFLISFIRKLRVNRILELEKKYPELKEKLRTSYDHTDTENPVALALHTEVINQVGIVDINAFLNYKKLFIKVMGVSALFFITIVISSYGFDFFNITEKAGVPMMPVVNKVKDFAAKTVDRLPLRQQEDYSDEGTIAKLGDEELNIGVDVFNTDIDITQIEEPKKNDFGDSYPEEVGAYAQEIYDEKISEEHREIIKNYFEKISR